MSPGWSIQTLLGHTLRPPDSRFRPRRDVHFFMDREMERSVPGYCAGIDVLSDCFEKDSMLHGDPERHEPVNAILRELRDDFVD